MNEMSRCAHEMLSHLSPVTAFGLDEATARRSLPAGTGIEPVDHD